MWRETVEQVANMLAMDPYPGFQGKYFSMPARNVVPKPVQKPHPPLWVACSNRDTIHLAAQLGLGALTFAFVDPAEARHWVDDYYETFKRECVPIGHAVNPNIAMVTGFSCHPDEDEARRRGTDGFRFFQFALGHHYGFGTHKPGRTNIWEQVRGGARRARHWRCSAAARAASARRTQLREHLRDVRRTRASTRRSSSSRAARTGTSTSASRSSCSRGDVMPEFHERGGRARTRGRRPELAPYIEAAASRARQPEGARRRRDPELPRLRAHRRRGGSRHPARGQPPARARLPKRMREIMEKTR